VTEFFYEITFNLVLQYNKVERNFLTTMPKILQRNVR